MFSKSFLAVLVVGTLVFAGAMGLATSRNVAPPQDISAFNNAVSNGTATVVAFHSPSCGSCKIQKPRLETLLKTNEFGSYQSYLLDFASNKELRDALKVTSPSTLIVYKNAQEVARLIGETDAKEIQSALAKAL